MGLDEYFAEPYMPKQPIVGQIYSFIYKADKPSVYNLNGYNFEFYDKMPLVLVTSTDRGMVKGINLNFCNFALRTLILNLLYDVDEPFFNGGASDMAHRGQPTIS